MEGQSNANAAAAPEEIAGDSRREQQANLVEQGFISRLMMLLSSVGKTSP